MAAAHAGAAVAGAGGDAEQGPGGAAAEGAEFGHVGQQGSGGGGSDAGDRAQHFGAPAQGGIGSDGGLQFRVEGLDAAFEGPALQAHLAHGGFGFEFLLQASQGGALVDVAPPHAHQILQLRQGRIQRRGGLQALQAPVARQHLGVHAVGLDQQAESLGEAPGAVRTHGHGLHASRGQALVQLRW